MCVGPFPVTITVRALGTLPDLVADDDLIGLLLAAWPGGPCDGDVLLVSSKAVAKVEGRVRRHVSREDAVAGETERLLASRGGLQIVRTRHGLVLAGAGVDASNTETGSVVLLPVDPDASARGLRTALATRTGRNVAIVVTDTAGRAWRMGQTDIAIGVAGLEPLHDLTGQLDGWHRPLAVTAPAVVDELAGAADLVLDKAARTPAAVVSGLSPLVLPSGVHGPGAVAVVRPDGTDLFGLGAADAVRAAVRRTPADRRGFAHPDSPELTELVEMAAARQQWVRAEVLNTDSDPLVVIRADPDAVPGANPGVDADALLAAGAVMERVRVLCWAAGLRSSTVAAPAGAICAEALSLAPYTDRRYVDSTEGDRGQVQQGS